MKPYTRRQVLIMEIGLQLAQLAGDHFMEIVMKNGLQLAKHQKQGKKYTERS